MPVVLGNVPILRTYIIRGMLDLLIISYKLSTNKSVTYYRIQQYPVDNTYNTFWSSTKYFETDF